MKIHAKGSIRRLRVWLAWNGVFAQLGRVRRFVKPSHASRVCTQATSDGSLSEVIARQMPFSPITALGKLHQLDVARLTQQSLQTIASRKMGNILPTCLPPSSMANLRSSPLTYKAEVPKFTITNVLRLRALWIHYHLPRAL